MLTGTDKKGISKQFLSYFQNLDKSVGERTLGPDQTISGKLQSTVDKAAQQARTIDQEKGYLKTLHDVSLLPNVASLVLYFFPP